ncbi:hypothetical protein ACLOJK_003474 [Asimina triloba]
MAWFRSASSLAKLAIRRKLAQGSSCATQRFRPLPLQYRQSLVLCPSQNSQQTSLDILSNRQTARFTVCQLRRLGVIELRKEDGPDFCTSVAKLSHLQALDATTVDDGPDFCTSVAKLSHLQALDATTVDEDEVLELHSSNRENYLTGDSSTLAINDDGNLVIHDGGGKSIIELGTGLLSLLNTLECQSTAIALDAENAIQMFAFYAECKQRRGRFKKFFYVFRDISALREICGLIESTEKRIVAISSSRSAYGPVLQLLPGGEGPTSSIKRLQEYRRSAIVAESEQVIGFVKDADALTQRLTTGDECRRVVSIVAIGGAGKTTLAKKLYNCSSVRDHFRDILAWVCVSQTYSVKELLQEVAVQVMRLSKTESSDLTIEALQEKLSGFLRKRKYLVVLDDMWKREAWDELRAAFPDGKNGSRMLMTSRIKEVALYADPGSHPHELPLLNQEESWALFLNNVFPHKNKNKNKNSSSCCPPNLEEVGKKIVEKCGGLPLAIRVIGGLLSTKEETERAWQNVLGSLNRHLSQESLCMQILTLSYHDLPGYLKPCFLYLGIFPEDYSIHVEELIWLWIAEGFIQRGEWESKEDAAEEWLKELLSRSMIQVVDWEYDGTIVRCRIHDLLREFAISEAQKYHLFQINGNILQQQQLHASTSTSAATTLTHVRRLGIDGNKKNQSSSQFSLPNLRSSLCFNGTFPGLLVGGTKWLRVLHLQRVRFAEEKNFPDVFAALPYLKYLNVDSGCISFPPSICKLYYLETFVCELATLPTTIWTMHRLRHLVAPCCEFEGRPHVGCLKHLHTLHLQAGAWMEEESLMELSALRNLRVGGYFAQSSYHSALASAIHKTVYLERLYLSVGSSVLPAFLPFTNHLRLRTMVLIGQLQRLFEFPPNLTTLRMSIKGSDQDPIPTLEKLRNLRVLEIENLGSCVKKMTSSAQGFPQLRQLTLESAEIEEWIVERGAMPALECLEILDCKKLKMLPEGLRDLTTLQHLRIFMSGNELYDRVQSETGADWGITSQFSLWQTIHVAEAFTPKAVAKFHTCSDPTKHHQLIPSDCQMRVPTKLSDESAHKASAVDFSYH